MDDILPADIISFWFKDIPDNSAILPEIISHWWQKDPVFDAAVKEKFESVLLAAANGELNHFLDEPEGRLALILLFDQFSRNMYRDMPEAFAYDGIALSFAVEGVKIGHDLKLPATHRAFFYMPFEHDERDEMQERSIAFFSQLLDDAPEQQRAVFKGFLDYAKRHKEVIDTFGRYPHRNKILGRESTQSELDYLKNNDGF